MNDKDIKDINIRQTIIYTLDLDGNRYIPYVEFMKALHESKYLNEIKKLKSSIEDCLFTFNNKKYLSLMAITKIFDNFNDEDLKQNICFQIFGIRLPKKNYVEKVQIGIEALNSLGMKCDELFRKIGQLDLDQCDLLHELENQKNITEIATKIKTLRIIRRKFKNEYRLLNYVKTNFETAKIDFKFLGTALQKFKLIKEETEQKEIIYFNKDGSNKSEMEIKIDKLREHFGGK